MRAAEGSVERVPDHFGVGRGVRRDIPTGRVGPRAEYRATEAPYGDDNHGFCRWLLVRPRLTPAAERDTLGAPSRRSKPL